MLPTSSAVVLTFFFQVVDDAIVWTDNQHDIGSGVVDAVACVVSDVKAK